MNTGSNRLSPYMDTNEVQKTIELLGFFKRINNTITYSVADWSTTLLDAVKNKIKGLVVAPPTEYANGILTIKGTLVGTSDINAALRHHPNPIKINVYGLSTLFVDENLTSPGTSLHLLAPQWKIVGTKTINLSGKDGANGAHGSYGSYCGASGGAGQSGQHGGNGGHFFGKGFLFDHVNHLTVNTNGGNGGNGGDGGDGMRGADGRDGDLSKVTEIKTCNITRTFGGRDGVIGDNVNNCAFFTEWMYEAARGLYNDGATNWDDSSRYSDMHAIGTTMHYEDKGTNGGVGGNAGRGGSKGKGGYCNLSIIDGHQWNSNPNPQNGQDGRKDGVVDRPGEGGRHGMHCQGIILTNTRLEYKYLGVSKSINLSNPTRAYCAKQHQEPGWYRPDLGYKWQANPGNSVDGLNSSREHPSTIPTPLDRNAIDTIIQPYSLYYLQEANNPIASPFIKVFPNLN